MAACLPVTLSFQAYLKTISSCLNKRVNSGLSGMNRKMKFITHGLVREAEREAANIACITEFVEKFGMADWIQ